MKETEQFRKGIALFNARKFFESHEVWEELWLVEPEPEKTFLQGLIQLAAACHHHGRGNRRGAQSLLAAGLAKLGRFPDDHRGIAVAKLRADAEQWAATLSGGNDLEAQRPLRIRLVTQAGRKKKRGG
jgi:predicted metal-dependent hydrolase